jgi:hypothetical protein
MGTRVSRCLAVLLVWFSVVGQAGGGVIYSNFGPGMAFDTDPFHSWTINGFLNPDSGQQAIAHQFTPAATETFSGAQVALTLFSGPGSVTVYLQADSNGLPGTVLEQINVTGLTGVPTIFSAKSVRRPQLQSGTPYWLTVVAGGPGVLAGWNWNSIGDSSTGSNFATTQGGSPAGPWGLFFSGATRSAFQINCSPPTAQEAVELLMDVEALLEAGTLTQDQADGLIDKLEAAIASLDRDHTRPACNQLQSFINQVNAFILANILSPEEGQALIDAAEDIQDQIGGGKKGHH